MVCLEEKVDASQKEDKGKARSRSQIGEEQLRGLAHTQEPAVQDRGQVRTMAGALDGGSAQGLG